MQYTLALQGALVLKEVFLLSDMGGRMRHCPQRWAYQGRPQLPARNSLFPMLLPERETPALALRAAGVACPRAMGKLAVQAGDTFLASLACQTPSLQAGTSQPGATDTASFAFHLLAALPFPASSPASPCTDLFSTTPELDLQLYSPGQACGQRYSRPEGKSAAHRRGSGKAPPLLQSLPPKHRKPPSSASSERSLQSSGLLLAAAVLSPQDSCSNERGVSV